MTKVDPVLEKSLRQFGAELLARYGLSREATKAQIDRLIVEKSFEESHRPYFYVGFLEQEALGVVIEAVPIDWKLIRLQTEEALFARGAPHGDHFHESGAAQCGP
ncbi:hypothetical protein N9Z12_01250 [Opitutaceae bacterium]|nr:hypothetical protein [Opitutaceae bacterium]